MAYRRSTARRSTRRSYGTASRRKAAPARRAPARGRRSAKRSSGGRHQTVKLVVEYAPPSVATPDSGMYPQVQQTTRVAKF